MSLFSWLDEPKTDIELGEEVLTRLNFYMSRYGYKAFSFDEYAAGMGFAGKTNTLLDGVGLTYRLMGRDEWDMDKGVERLARESAGRMPTKSSLDAALRDAATAVFSFSDYQKNTTSGIGYVAAGIADQALSGLESIGSSLVKSGDDLLGAVENTAKAAKWGLPVILLLGVAGYVALNVMSAPRIPKTAKMPKLKIPKITKGA